MEVCDTQSILKLFENQARYNDTEEGQGAEYKISQLCRFGDHHQQPEGRERQSQS